MISFQAVVNHFNKRIIVVIIIISIIIILLLLTAWYKCITSWILTGSVLVRGNL